MMGMNSFILKGNICYSVSKMYLRYVDENAKAVTF